MASAGRVIAGTARGTRLAAPGGGTRPIADRVKQTLFAILAPELDGSVVLDLFAGSGAMGIEALSRGAARAVFVDRDAGAVRTIGENLRRTRLETRATVLRREAIAWLAGSDGVVAEGPFDLVLIDPPYEDAAVLARAIELAAPFVRPGGRVVAKHFWRDPPAPVVGLLASERERRFGETALTFYRCGEPDDDRQQEAGER